MVGILNRPIHTFAPMQDGQRFVAIIQGFPMHFRGDSAMQAKKLADDFRLVESLKVLGSKFPDELREKAEAAKVRTAARKAAKVPPQFKK
jgi:hypothetical protein